MNREVNKEETERYLGHGGKGTKVELIITTFPSSFSQFRSGSQILIG